MASKYKSVPTVVDNIRFDSKKEAIRYSELRILERSKIITDLKCHVPFLLCAHEVKTGSALLVGKYVADFVYIDSNGKQCVEDVKGVRTATYKLKKKIVEANYGIRIVET